MSRLQEAIILSIMTASAILTIVSAVFNWIVLLKILLWVWAAFMGGFIIVSLITEWKDARKEIAQKRKERKESEETK